MNDADDPPEFTEGSIKRVFVIGGTGKIGRVVVQLLASSERPALPEIPRANPGTGGIEDEAAAAREEWQGPQVHVFTRREEACDELFRDQVGQGTVHVHRGDLYEGAGPLASAIQGSQAEVVVCSTAGNPLKVDRVGTRNLAQALRQCPFVRRVVYVSSAGITQRFMRFSLNLGAMGFAESKRAGERYLRAYGQDMEAISKPEVILLRPTWLTQEPLDVSSPSFQALHFSQGDQISVLTTRIPRTWVACTVAACCLSPLRSSGGTQVFEIYKERDMPPPNETNSTHS